jgi:hypothetical protein
MSPLRAQQVNAIYSSVMMVHYYNYRNSGPYRSILSRIVIVVFSSAFNSRDYITGVAKLTEDHSGMLQSPVVLEPQTWIG